MKKKKLLLLAAAIAAVAVVVLIICQAPTIVSDDIHYYHHELTADDADAGLGFDYGPSDDHVTVDGWRASFEKRLSRDPALLADWYYLLVKNEDIDAAAEHGNDLHKDLLKDDELRQKTYEEVKAKLDGATIEKLTWSEGTKYHTGIMKPEAPTEEVPILDSKDITTKSRMTVMAIYAYPSKTGDGDLTAYCVPGCGDQPAELQTGKGTGGGNKPSPSPTKPDPKDPDPKKGDGCDDKQTWETSYGQQAEKYTDSKTGGGNGHMNYEDSSVPGTTRIDEGITPGWTTQPDKPTTPPVVGGGTGRVSGDD